MGKYVPPTFRFDGHGINDAQGNRICEVVSCEPYETIDGKPVRNREFGRLSHLFAAVADLQQACHVLYKLTYYDTRPKPDDHWGRAILLAKDALRKAKGLPTLAEAKKGLKANLRAPKRKTSHVGKVR